MNSAIKVIPIIILALLIPLDASAQSIEVGSVLIRVIDQVDVPARALGALSDVHVNEGNNVVQGQLLAQIDDTEVTLAMRRAQAELEIAQLLATDDTAVRSATKSWRFAKADLGRLTRAQQAQPRSVSESELERARLESENAELEIEKAESELRSAIIRQKLASSDYELAKRNVEIRKVLSPIDGILVESNHMAGEWVQPGDKMFRIVRTDRLRAEGFVDATEAARGLQGSRVSLILLEPVASKERITGTIGFVSPEIDPVNGQVRVWADFKNLDGRLRPGLRARMVIDSQEALMEAGRERTQ